MPKCADMLVKWYIHKATKKEKKSSRWEDIGKNILTCNKYDGYSHN